ncbi:response regulator [Aureimonas altamirensis]|uniref:response regulator FixJ n=1 Tax=Aureimonas altamirensis TaxID=370622 RepID=UPI001E4B7CC7|nr:response regulator FixJ [Aureimonas altamirensis]UHD46479.1 response regulator [Aureimonas altamirensis]
MNTEPKVHVIDDDAAVRNSLAFLIDTAGLSVVTYPSAPAFLAALADPLRGCVVTDVRMPEMSGIDLLKRLKAQDALLPVIVMTGHGDVPLAVEAMREGAVDFIEKPFDDEAILTSVSAALEGEAGLFRDDKERCAIRERIGALSARERQVLDGLVEGHANKRIAFDLAISARTVEIYRANVMTKMRVRSLPELVRLVLTAGVQPG